MKDQDASLEALNFPRVLFSTIIQWSGLWRLLWGQHGYEWNENSDDLDQHKVVSIIKIHIKNVLLWIGTILCWYYLWLGCDVLSDGNINNITLFIFGIKDIYDKSYESVMVKHETTALYSTYLWVQHFCWLQNTHLNPCMGFVIHFSKSLLYLIVVANCLRKLASKLMS